jgi:hypothetical protein
MFVFSYRVEHVINELNYWTELTHDKIESRVDFRQRPQSSWQAGQPIRTAVQYPEWLRYGRVSVEEGDSAGAEERGPGTRAKKHGEGNARREEPPQQVNAGGTRMMNNVLRTPERAADLQLRCQLRHTIDLQGTERTKRWQAKSRIMLHGLQ